MKARKTSSLPAREAAAAPRPHSAVRNIMVVGVGGQGVIMVSKLLALLGQKQGLQVKQSEVQGMAKRGGIVYGHIRIGEQVWSPVIPKGEADVLIALEWAEGLRWLDHLKPETGVFIADTKQIVPPFACRNRKVGAVSGYAKETPAEALAQIPNGFVLDATQMATEAGDLRASNIVLCGALSAILDYPVEDWLEIADALVPKKTREINRKAFLAGRAWAEAARHDPNLRVDDSGLKRSAPMTARDVAISLEITPAWCKGCDICVKLCPERCLALNEAQVVVLTKPEACTGCRLCEWLCPDFAITVHLSERKILAA